MYAEEIIKLNNAKSSKAIVEDIEKKVPLPQKKGVGYVIGSWQSGDFCHIYAAAVRHFSSPECRDIFVVVVLVENTEAGGWKILKDDIKFAMDAVSKKGQFLLLYTESLGDKNSNQSKAITVLSTVGKNTVRLHSPYEATFDAGAVVKNMVQGMPLSPVWADISRGNDLYVESYDEICSGFMQEYIEKFSKSQGREKFICLWARNSDEIGGANPQYNSSPKSNYDICNHLKIHMSTVKVLLVGPGFNEKTRQMPNVFDIGPFWLKQRGIKGRFQENGFFDYMTAFYDCDVVHLGMKSGGMDVLALWGQKVVFIDSVRAPAVTKARVGAWNNQRVLRPVEIRKMPTKLGKQIDEARSMKEGDERSRFDITTFKKSHIKDIEKLTEDKNFQDGFDLEDLFTITRALREMLI